MWPIPISMPGWLYAIAFLIISFFVMKDYNRGDIGHDAHLGGAIVGFLIAAGLHPEIVIGNVWMFLTILAPSLLILIYLWFNPMFLPTAALFPGRIAKIAGVPTKRKKSAEHSDIDSILDKIAKKGMENLSADEKKILHETSSKYQRRSQSKKPQSGLAI